MINDWYITETSEPDRPVKTGRESHGGHRKLEGSAGNSVWKWGLYLNPLMAVCGVLILRYFLSDVANPATLDKVDGVFYFCLVD